MSERFQSESVAEVPDFQRHVGPLLGRLGCNGRACHGSFQGQGGFQLSLFGFDFSKDHQAIRSRVIPAQPASSLLLRKPTLQNDHEGGRRFAEDSWQYRLLHRWVEAGARTASVRELHKLELVPGELQFAHSGESKSLQVIAHWADGSAEDVTCLCRFETRDESIAAIDLDGHVKATGRGDTHIVVSYDNAVAVVPVLLPVTDRIGSKYPHIGVSTRVDSLILARQRQLGIVPSDVCSDTAFLRRVSIDLTGTLPVPADVLRFQADTAPGKRVRLVSGLLDSPEYAAWWANRLCDMTGNNPFRQADGGIGQELAVQWYSWIHRRVTDNTPYDKLVAGIALATSRREDQSYEQYAAEMSSYLRDVAPEDFALRPTLPHYWTRRTVEKPEDKALAFAHSFLGLRLQCAQCHKHPSDRWTQSDFQQFTQFFTGLELGVQESAKSDFERLLLESGQSTKGNQRRPGAHSG